MINFPELAVDDALSGLVSIHPGLSLLKGHRVVIRSDIASVKADGKVGND